MCEICGKDSHQLIAPSRRSFMLAAAAIGLSFADTVEAKEKKKERESEDDDKEKKKKPPKPQNVLSPDAALERLRKGNTRYVEGVSLRHDFKHEREALVGGQNPYAAILSCADSRIAPEYAFDTARGDLFVCRVAGNFASDEMIASLEYGVAVLNTPLILVLGHESCGAIDAAIKSLKDNTTLSGHLPSLVTAIAPAVKAVSQAGGDVPGNATRQNVIDNVAKLASATPILSAAVEQKKLKVVGGIYRLKDGRVDIVA
jgi:carbonic anhydrase